MTTTEVLKLLSCPTRLLMLRAVAGGPCTVGELARIAGVRPSCASYHVGQLAFYGLVDVEPEENRRLVTQRVREIRLVLSNFTP